MYFTVYKITNIITNKYYIGKHKTKNLDDGYMGSGKKLLDAYKKYTKDNFIKEILFVFDNEEDMNRKEAELVVVSEETYNLCPGGNGGFTYINSSNVPKFKGKRHSEETKKKISEKRKGRTNYIPTEEYKKRMSEIMKQKHAENKGFNSRKQLKGRAPDFHSGCCEFESRLPLQNSKRLWHMEIGTPSGFRLRALAGSNPVSRTNHLYYGKMMKQYPDEFKPSWTHYNGVDDEENPDLLQYVEDINYLKSRLKAQVQHCSPQGIKQKIF